METHEYPPVKLRDRKRTKGRLLMAAGKYIQRHGIEQMDAVKIARASRIPVALIYRYFGTAGNLRDEYLRSIEYTPGRFKEKTGKTRDLDSTAGLKKLMLELCEDFRQDKAAQKMLRWEISTGEIIVSRHYDAVIMRLLEASGKTPDHADKNALVSFMCAAIYFIAASANYPKKMSDIDLATEEGWQRIENLIGRIIDGICQ